MRAFFLILGAFVTLGCAQGSDVPTGGGPGNGGNPGTGGTPTTGGSSEGGTSNDGGNASGGSPATGGGGSATDGGGGAGQGGQATGGGGSGGSGPDPIEQSCPANQFATGFDANGVIQCAALDTTIPPAVNAGCDVFLGSRDSCGACSTAPEKWGHVSGAACANGIGVDDTCSSALLGGTTVGLFGLNLDGDVDDNDKLYAGFLCDPGVPAPAPGPCTADQRVVAYDGSTVTCEAAGASALETMRQSCSIYLGWRDSCDACSLAPAKWGFAGSTACNVGSGAGNTCVDTILGADTVPLLGIDLDGNMNDDDKIYVGLHCLAGATAGGKQPSTCPAGQYIVGTHADGTVECASPAPAISSYVAAHCSLYFGWRDSCDGCTTIPAKYGRAREGFCANDGGSNGSCAAYNLNGQNVSLYGLNTDGDVGDDDKLYIGFECH